MNTKKIIYEVTITICSYYKMHLKFSRMKDAQDLIEMILLHVNEDESDNYSIVIIPTIEEPEPAEREPIEDGKEDGSDE